MKLSSTSIFCLLVIGSVLHFSQGVRLVSLPFCRTVVTGFYRTILHRSPDAGGLRHYVGRCRLGLGNLRNIRNAIYNSNERKQLCKRKVTQFYQKILHRQPEKKGFDHWNKKCFTEKMSLHSIEDAFYRSPERKNLCKNRVAAFYRRHLGREKDIKGFKHWVNQCFARRRSLGDIEKAFLNSKEYKCRMKVKELYIRILHRLPDVGGWRHYTARCFSGPFGPIVSSIFNSIERQRLCARDIIKYYRMRHGRNPPLAELRKQKHQCTVLQWSICDVVKIK